MAEESGECAPNVCTFDTLDTTPLVAGPAAPLVAAPVAYECKDKPARCWPEDFALNPSAAGHVGVLLAVVLWLATGADAFLVIIAGVLILTLCCVPQALLYRIVDWAALALVAVLLVYRDNSAILEDVMLVVFRVHRNATAAP